MKITKIRFMRVKGKWAYDGPLGEDRLVRPIDIYPEFKAQRGSWPMSGRTQGSPYPMEAIFLFIDTDMNVSGSYGPVSGEEARTIASQFGRLIIGENPHAVERIWDKMYRHAIHGRKGNTMMAISKADELVGRATITKQSILKKKTLADINLEEEIGCDVIAIQRKKAWIVHPDDSWELAKKDRVIVRGSSESVKKLQRLAAGELTEIA